MKKLTSGWWQNRSELYFSFYSCFFRKCTLYIAFQHQHARLIELFSLVLARDISVRAFFSTEIITNYMGILLLPDGFAQSSLKPSAGQLNNCNAV
ncbi:hypothetical protein [Erwinia mallotivora]|uniref:hypothetical protein n=1 Tax=Erwinia mallotivora TaxID=69222 RepID=UPI001363644C|nr:hypothetical protein [Erwinia mallotivora]